MYARKIDIKNFRLLQEVSLSLEERTTVIVGRNNCGKTSLTELFRRVLSSDGLPAFRLEDFSLPVHEKFWEAYNLSLGAEAEDDEIRKVIPYIEVKLTIKYDSDQPLGLLGDCIIDLDPACTDACICARYQLKDGGINALFGDFQHDLSLPLEEQKRNFFQSMQEQVPKHYTATVVAIDPNDHTNSKPLELPYLRALLQSGFINAQRGLDDITHKDKDVLGKILESLFKNASSELATQSDRAIAQKLDEAVEKVQADIDEGFNQQLQELLPTFSLFGYPGLRDPRLCTETTLDVERLLVNHTKVHYTGVNGINLPEAYNGLGSRNLVYILLKLLEFYKSFNFQTDNGGHACCLY